MTFSVTMWNVGVTNIEGTDEGDWFSASIRSLYVL